MKSFYEREDYDMTSIQQLIEYEVEESIYLDFKEARALSKEGNKKIEISKDVAAFANSDGGIIIYGIKEKEHKASALSFIDGNVFTKEWLEKVIESNIQRNIPDLKIFYVRFDGDISKTVYVVKIPASLEAPHISKDNKYYRRYNFQSHAMEEYEIRNLYNRKGTAKLQIDTFKIRKDSSENFKDGLIKYILEVDIANVGQIVENTYKINLYSKNNPEIEFSWDKFSSNDYTVLDEKQLKISALGIHPIFPDEVLTAFRVNFEFKQDLIPIEIDFDVVLFYQNGEDETEYRFLIDSDEIKDISKF